jgi:hypothetical protein
MGGDAKSFFLLKKKDFAILCEAAARGGCPLGNPSGWVSVVFNITRRLRLAEFEEYPSLYPLRGGGKGGGI